jgi:hypothetical protein
VRAYPIPPPPACAGGHDKRAPDVLLGRNDAVGPRLRNDPADHRMLWADARRLIGPALVAAPRAFAELACRPATALQSWKRPADKPLGLLGA